MTQNENLTLIHFLVINKDLFKLNKSNADVLVQNSTQRYALLLNFYVNKDLKSVLHRIQKTKMSIKHDEILVSKIIHQSNIAQDNIELQDLIYQEILQLEKQITEKQSIQDAINNLYNNKNFDAQLN